MMKFQIKNSEENFICYHGPININLVSFTSNYVKKNIQTDSLAIGKIHKVFIELTQNVSYYSARQYDKLRKFGSGIGWFRIDEKKEFFEIATGNVILTEHAPILKKNSIEINSLGESALRRLKRETRRQAGKRDIGAHIGLIQMGLITGNPIDLDFEPLDEKYSFFIITTRVNKNEK